MNTERKSSLLIVAACLLWAMDLLVRYPVSLKMNFTSIVFLESLTGLLFVSPWLFRNIKTLFALKKRDWLMTLFIGGIGMTVAGYLQTVSIQKATPGLFSFFQIFQPLFVIYMAHLLLKEKVDNMYLYWGIWVILSAVLMFSVDLQLMFASDFILSDMVIALSTMLIWGFCTILGKKFLMKHSALTLVSLRWVFAFIFSGLILLTEEESLPVDILFQGDVLLRFIFMGAIAGIFSMGLYSKGLKQLPAGKVSFLEISYAAFGMIFSAIYTFESLNFFQVLGGASFFAFMILFLSRQDSGPSTIKTRQFSPSP